MSTQTEISVRAYARSLGTTHTAINKAISTGKIKKGYNPKTKKIKPDLANQEYGEAASIERPKAGVNKKKLFSEPDDTTPIQEMAIAEGINPDDIVIYSNLSYQDLLKRREIIGALLDKNKLLEQSGVLVRREAIDAQLFAAGNQLKKSFQAIGQRVIANVLAAPDPVTAQAYIDNEINAVLTGFAKERLINYTHGK